MTQVAFELRDAYKGDGEDAFSGGSVSLPDGESLDVAEALEEGDGVIVLEPEAQFSEGATEKERQTEFERAWRHERIVDTLDNYPALKRVGAPDDAAVLGGEVSQAQSAEENDLEKKTIPELLDMGRGIGAEVTTSMNKPDLIEAIQEKQAEGDEAASTEGGDA